jgi:hypothetical protein
MTRSQLIAVLGVSLALLAGIFAVSNLAESPQPNENENEFPKVGEAEFQEPYRELQNATTGNAEIKNAASADGPSQTAAHQDSSARQREELLVRYRAAWKSQLPDVENVLGLHAEEFEQLLTLLVDFDVRLKALNEASSTQDTFPKEKELYKERASAIKQYLGDAKNQEWLNYLETTGIRAQVHTLESALTKLADPLSEAQRQGLMDALIETNRRYQTQKDERRRQAPHSSRSQQTALFEYKQFSKQMHLAASPFLSAMQLEEYDKVLAASQQ